MEVNEYAVLSDTILLGIDGGWERAHNESPTPTKQQVIKEIHDNIMLLISEYFIFEDLKDLIKFNKQFGFILKSNNVMIRLWQ